MKYKQGMGTEPIDYNALLKQLQKRDRQAFDLLYRDMRVTLYVVAMSILEDEPVAQDLVQEFFIDFWHQQLHLQIESSLKGYMVRSVRNRSFKLLKKQQTRRRRQSAIPAPEELLPPSQRLEHAELMAAIHRALKKVPKGAAEVFTLYYTEALSYAQIAEKLHISVHTVRNQLARALRILRKELKNQ